MRLGVPNAAQIADAVFEGPRRACERTARVRIRFRRTEAERGAGWGRQMAITAAIGWRRIFRCRFDDAVEVDIFPPLVEFVAVDRDIDGADELAGRCLDRELIGHPWSRQCAQMAR